MVLQLPTCEACHAARSNRSRTQTRINNQDLSILTLSASIWTVVRTIPRTRSRAVVLVKVGDVLAASTDMDSIRLLAFK